MLNYIEWLKKPNTVKVLLVHVQVEYGGSVYTKYLSTSPAAVDSIEYLPIIKTGASVSSSISLDYSSNISFGDIELVNTSGQYDTWLNYNWVNKSCKVYFGELAYPGVQQTLSVDYELVFDGIVEDIDSKSNTVLNLKIRDKLEKLNYPITEAVLGNYFHGTVLPDTSTEYDNSSKKTLKPLVFGEVHNVTPLATDPSQLEFMVSSDPVERIIEVLDNGVPVSFRTVKSQTDIGSIPAGSFRLDKPPSGTITASVQGVAKTILFGQSTSYTNSYYNSAANIIATILRFYGKQLDLTELDQNSFSYCGKEPVGVYVNDRKNVLLLCQELAKSCGCSLAVTRTGKLKLVPLTIPTSASITIAEHNVVQGSYKLVQKPALIAGVKLGYARNYTVLTGLLTGIPEEHKNLFTLEYLEALATNTLASAAYSITSTPTLESTHLIDQQSAASVANSRLTLLSNPRKILGVQGVCELLSLEVGDPVLVGIPRFGVPAGTPGLVMSARHSWLTGKVDLEVLV